MNKIIEKTNYCLNCKIKPCSTKGCPLENNIPEFIKATKEENYREAYKILSKTTVLPGICGKICPHMKQCQGSCVRGIKGEPVSIGEIENYIFEKAQEEKIELEEVIEKTEQLKNKKIAIVGGGPAGLTCAAFLAKNGANVTIYEKYNYLGGLLVHGIPDFRLDKKRVEDTANKILKLGIEIKYEQELGKNIKLSELEQEYDAIFLGIGANKSSKMGVKGENLKGVYGGNELLEHRNFPELTGKTVCVIGGGNVAIDCSRTLKKLGAENVNVIYRRGKTRRKTIFISKQYCRNKRKTKSRKIRINKNRINSKRRRKQTSTSKCRK